MAALTAAAVFCAAPAWGEPSPDSEDLRAADLAAARKALQAELDAHGGSWQVWAKRLEPFRSGLREAMQGKWPWKAEKNFRFLGKSARLLLMDGWDEAEGRTTPAEAIIHLDRQLKARGIDLIYVLIPDKLSVYPDYLVAAAPEDRQVALAARRLQMQLLEADVEILDLYTPFAALRKQLGPDKPLYYDRDSHWRNRAAVLAGRLIARRLDRYRFARRAPDDLYVSKVHERTDGAKADTVRRVVDRPGGQAYRDVEDSPVILTGDSFSMYNMHLGGHLSAQVARHLGLPLTFICREGLSMNMPAELARRAARDDVLVGRKVLVWTHAARFLSVDKWQKVDLPGLEGPGQAKQAPSLFMKQVSAKVAAVSNRPKADADYPHFVMKLLVKDVRDADGKALLTGPAVVRILAMRDRKLLAPARIQPGQTLQLRLTDFSAMKKKWGQVNTGSLEDIQAEAKGPEYWAELVGQKE
jgi:hypothetical protein